MVEQEQMKVYELAKELGVDSISLLDKLNGLNIKVKSHMSDLGADDVRTVRASLGKKSAATAAPKKTAARVRKKAPEAAAAPAGATAAPVTTESAQSAAERKAAAPVIRRRTKNDGATESTVAKTAASNGYAETPESEAMNAEHAAAEAAHEAYAQESEAHVQGYDDAEAQTAEANSSAGAEMSAGDADAAPAQEARDHAGTAAPAGASFQATESVAPGEPARPSRQPIVLPPRPVAPRRSILKIVEVSAPAPRPMIKPTGAPMITPRGSTRPTPTPNSGTGDKDGFRIIKMDKANLDQMVEEEAAKKRGGGREPEIRPEDVRFADYRKKEMVFLPKRKKLPTGKQLKKTELTTKGADKRIVRMENTISVADFAEQLGVKATEVVRKLMGMGQMVTINQAIDFDTATIIGQEYSHEVRNVAFKEEALLETAVETDATLVQRPPIVTIMGHVDHGKTSLLDALREANVAAGEAGGITQHIGAYTIEKDGKLITFIDTPGHEAFTSMRARGANVTDIVILVVAADDAVMPQTREALSHAQAAGVPIIVAVNKMDKPGANPEKVKQQLSELNLLAEDWGGQTMFIGVSALKKTGLDKLLEAILLQAEVLDLKANPEARAQGTILEARVVKGRGPVATLLVKRGTLHVGDAIVSGQHSGRVKAMTNHLGQAIKEALPGFAAEVLGLESLPGAGERFDSPDTEADARKIASNRVDTMKAHQLATGFGKVSLDDLFAKIQAGNVKELSVVLKGDVFGSVEAIKESLIKSSTEKVKVKVIFSAPGGISESDVMLASASGAIIIGFNVRPETKARQLAEAEHVEIKSYSIIYELLDDIKKSMVGLLDKKKVEKFLGRAEVRQTFSVPKLGTVAGSAVIDGKIVRGANVRLLRDSRIIFEGKMSSLRRFKDDAKEVATGFECGIGLENYNDLKAGDVIEAYQIEMITPELT